MPAGDLITADFQFEFNGLLFGDATVYEVVSVDGIVTSPRIRAGDVERPTSDGDVAGTDRYAFRTVEFTVDIYAASTNAMFQTSLDNLMDATVKQTADLPLVFQFPTWGKRRINCRPRQRSIPVTVPTSRGLAERVRLQFYAADPLIYNNTETTETSPDTVVNAGNYPTWPTITLTAGATITNTTTSKAIVTTGTGTLVIDTKTRTVTKAGVNAYDQIDPATEWFSLVPGNNVLTGTATSVVYRDAWV